MELPFNLKEYQVPAKATAPVPEPTDPPQPDEVKNVAPLRPASRRDQP